MCTYQGQLLGGREHQKEKQSVMGRAVREHRGKTVTVALHAWSRKEKPAVGIHVLVSEPTKRVNAGANEAKRSRGNCFVARHLDEEHPFLKLDNWQASQ